VEHISSTFSKKPARSRYLLLAGFFLGLLQLQKWRRYISLKCGALFKLDGITAQKIVMWGGGKCRPLKV
jgi:hypothetical protein